MFTIFFTIIFIAELIVAGWLISLILRLDKAVCSLNEKITDSRTLVKKSLLQFSLLVNNALVAVAKLKVKLEEKKKNYTLAIVRSLVVCVLFFALDKEAKQAVSMVDTVISLVKILRKMYKSLVPGV